jgi:hypothetical protein
VRTGISERMEDLGFAGEKREVKKKHTQKTLQRGKVCVRLK